MIIYAIKLNKEIIKNAKSPHQRDLARMRLNILKNKKQKIREETYGLQSNIRGQGTRQSVKL